MDREAAALRGKRLMGSKKNSDLSEYRSWVEKIGKLMFGKSYDELSHEERTKAESKTAQLDKEGKLIKGQTINI